MAYTLLCDDVRLEVGNKVSLMGVFQNIMVDKLPVSLIKFAVVNHWRGDGSHQTETRILSPNKVDLVVTSQRTHVELAPGGFTDNVSFLSMWFSQLPGHIGFKLLQMKRLLMNFH